MVNENAQKSSNALRFPDLLIVGVNIFIIILILFKLIWLFILISYTLFTAMSLSDPISNFDSKLNTTYEVFKVCAIIILGINLFLFYFFNFN